MKTNKIIPITMAATLVIASLHTAFADDAKDGKEVSKKQAKLLAQAKVSREDAQKTALAKVPNGTVKDAELEKEHGKLIWSFDISIPDSKDIMEVAVNAKTGDVVSVERETPEQQAKEAREDAEKEKKDKKDKDDDDEKDEKDKK